MNGGTSAMRARTPAFGAGKAAGPTRNVRESWR